MIWLVNIISILLIVFIIWWFWVSRPAIHRATESIIYIRVSDGVYTPSYIDIEKGRAVTLRFERFDTGPCAEVVRFDDFGIRLELPLNQVVDVQLTIDDEGEYGFGCDMRMYSGRLIVS